MSKDFHLVKSEGPFELRQYNHEVMAKILFMGSFEEAKKIGGKILSDYFNGNNFKNLKIKSSPNQEVSWTKTGWLITRKLPASFLLNSCPKPVDRQIRIIECASRQICALKTFGPLSFSKFQGSGEMLKLWMERNGYLPKSPFSLSISTKKFSFRRFFLGEVMIETNL